MHSSEHFNKRIMHIIGVKQIEQWHRYVWKEDDELNVFQTLPATCDPQYNNSKKKPLHLHQFLQIWYHQEYTQERKYVPVSNTF